MSTIRFPRKTRDGVHQLFTTINQANHTQKLQLFRSKEPARPKRQRFSTVSGLLNSRCSRWHLLDYHSCTLLMLPSFRRVLRQCPHPTNEGHTSCLFVCKTFITVHKYKNINYFQIHITVWPVCRTEVAWTAMVTKPVEPRHYIADWCVIKELIF